MRLRKTKNIALTDFRHQRKVLNEPLGILFPCWLTYLSRAALPPPAAEADVPSEAAGIPDPPRLPHLQEKNKTVWGSMQKKKKKSLGLMVSETREYGVVVYQINPKNLGCSAHKKPKAWSTVNK